MSRYIDADELIKSCDRVINFGIADKNGEHLISAECVKATIEKMDAADVVEVVRCKDCKFYPGGYFSDDRIMIGTYMHCPNFKDDGFCSYGRRKEE